MHVFHLQMCNRCLRLDAPLMESQQQMGLVCAVLGLDAVLGGMVGLDAVMGGMAMSSMRSHELEHTAELPKVQEVRLWSSRRTRWNRLLRKLTYIAHPTPRQSEKASRRKLIGTSTSPGAVGGVIG